MESIHEFREAFKIYVSSIHSSELGPLITNNSAQGWRLEIIKRMHASKIPKFKVPIIILQELERLEKLEEDLQPFVNYLSTITEEKRKIKQMFEEFCRDVGEKKLAQEI